MIKAVLLDVDNTLLDFNKCAHAAMYDAAKPAPTFFEACLAALAPLRSEEVPMIGDSLTADIAGAKACGIRTCWYRHGSDKDGSIADYCVADLREICGIL